MKFKLFSYLYRKKKKIPSILFDLIFILALVFILACFRSLAGKRSEKTQSYKNVLVPIIALFPSPCGKNIKKKLQKYHPKRRKNS